MNEGMNEPMETTASTVRKQTEAPEIKQISQHKQRAALLPIVYFGVNLTGTHLIDYRAIFGKWSVS